MKKPPFADTNGGRTPSPGLVNHDNGRDAMTMIHGGTDLRTEARTIAEQRPDAIISWTVDDRRAFLLEIAEHVRVEQGHHAKPFTRCVPSVVPNVASALCPQPLVVFASLVDAVAALAGFNQHSRWDQEAEDAERKVEAHLNELLAGGA